MVWLLLLLAIVLGIAWHFTNIVIYPETKSFEKTYALELEEAKFNPAAWASWPKQEVWIRSPFGYPLFGIYIPCDGAHKTLILAHGITYTYAGSIKYAGMFRKRGFNLLLYDHRNHGRSGGENTTFGYYEKHDLKAWVDWVLAQGGDGCIVGTHGESMGAAIALQHAAIDPRLAFVVADCPYASAAEEIVYRLKVDYHLPPFPLFHLANAFSKLRAGFAFEDAAPIKTIHYVNTPILFIHGEEDDYIPSEASVKLHQAKQGIKQLYLVPGVEHAQSLESNPQAYEQEVARFLAKLELA